MEIERKFAPESLPDLSAYPSKSFEQGYLSVAPVVRVRREDDAYFITYKGAGLMAREEYNLPLTKEAYEHLREKCDGNILTKTRYFIPLDDTHTVELDVFEGAMKGLVMAEVEFETKEAALSFVPPQWLGEDVTSDPRYHNSNMIYETYNRLFGQDQSQ